MILIQYTFCQIQRISPHDPLAFRSVCARSSNTNVLIMFTLSTLYSMSHEYVTRASLKEP